MNTLFVGDLHVMVSNLEDTARIFDLIEITALKEQVKTVIFLGDIFHTHAVIRQEVGHFVKDRMVRLYKAGSVNDGFTIVLLAGNHDGSSPHSVVQNADRLIFGDIGPSIIVVDQTNGYVYGDFFMVPFMGDNDEFVRACQLSPDKILVCHQTVEGAYYENNSLAPGGVNQDLLPQKLIIAGHIHLKQKVGKVIYPGTPRALTASEYNVNKEILLYDTVSGWFKQVPTDHLVKRYFRYELKQGSESEMSLDVDMDRIIKPGDDVRLVVSGTEEFYKESLEKYEYLSGKIRFIPNIRKVLQKKVDIESDGSSVQKAFHQYVHEIYDAPLEVKGKVWKKLQELIPNL